MSIIRFQLQTADLPIFQFKVDPATGQGAYSFTVKWSGLSVHEYTQPILWYPEDLSASPTSDEYYYAYSVQHIIRVFNQSMRVAFSQLYQNVLDDISETIKMPDRADSLYAFFQSNGSGKWILNSDFVVFNEPYIRGNDRTVPDESHTGLYMNNALFSILCGFPVVK